ncbi:hypothetical protein [Microviridae sp.]|nr:hypothetical protein [Microviridae sp.]UOF82657.1 hypothetical protein [Microviridae sp.]UOF82695.1 hypothetical protein [Microviridae sp.]
MGGVSTPGGSSKTDAWRTRPPVDHSNRGLFSAKKRLCTLT